MNCLCCGKYTKNKKFCCRSCAVKYNNTNRKHTKETKEKISNSLKTKYENKLKIKKYKDCIVCGRTFELKKVKSGRFSKAKTCSVECYKKLMRINGINAYKRILSEGKFKGWQSRNKLSYAEKFFMQVLNNNKIEYVKEYHLDKKYFLDFFIVKNNVLIDLEIDGKQHSYSDRIKHDKERDEYIKSKNIKIYRIKWNEINSEKGKNTMKEKIDKFIIFYRNL